MRHPAPDVGAWCVVYYHAVLSAKSQQRRHFILRRLPDETLERPPCRECHLNACRQWMCFLLWKFKGFILRAVDARFFDHNLVGFFYGRRRNTFRINDVPPKPTQPSVHRNHDPSSCHYPTHQTGPNQTIRESQERSVLEMTNNYITSL